MKHFSHGRVKSLCKKVFRISLFLSLAVYAFLRMIFYELPFSFSEDGAMLVKIIVSGYAMTLSTGLLFYTLVAILSGLKDFLVNPGYNQPGVFFHIIQSVSLSPDLLEEEPVIYNESLAA